MLLSLDVLGTVKTWNLAPALLDRRTVFTPARVPSLIRALWSPLKRSDPAIWEEIAYSLAFHLRAGETSAQAVRGVSRDRDTPAHAVLKSACQAYDAGASLLSALGAETRESPELAYLIGIFEMGTVSGGDLPALLCHAAEAMRRRRIMRGEARAKLGEAKATAVLLSVLPWAIGAFTFGQDAVVRSAVLADSKGRLLIAAAVAFWLAGNLAVALVLRSLSLRQIARRTGGPRP